MTLRTRLKRRLAALGTSLFVLVALAGCSVDEIKRGWLPSQHDMTSDTGRIMDLWVGSWIAAWLVGFLTWGLMFWCMIAYRRRKGDTSLPVQLRYHMPLEIMYTIIPIFMVGVLFFFTARDMAEINKVDKNVPDNVNIQVIGKRWAWDFNYTDSNVYDTSEQVPMSSTDVTESDIPTLYLPVDRPVNWAFSRDVDHSFWVPAFLYKRDMIPGKTDQYYQFTPHIVGTYPGKCAELCGEYHSEMIFQVKVVSQADYDQHMTQLQQAGQTGSLPLDLGRADGPAEDDNVTGGEG